VFESGVPGVPQGVPPELVKGYQQPADEPPPVVQAKPAEPAPAKAKPAASGRFAITATTFAGQPSAEQRSTIACMFEPRSEMRMTMRFTSSRSDRRASVAA